MLIEGCIRVHNRGFIRESEKSIHRSGHPSMHSRVNPSAHPSVQIKVETRVIQKSAPDVAAKPRIKNSECQPSTPDMCKIRGWKEMLAEVWIRVRIRVLDRGLIRLADGGTIGELAEVADGGCNRVSIRVSIRVLKERKKEGRAEECSWRCSEGCR